MSNLLNGVNFRFSSLDDFESRGLATRAIRTLLDGPQFLAPRLYGRTQPLKQTIDPNNIEPLVDLWVPRKKESVPGSVKFPDGMLVMEYAPKGEYLIHWKKQSEPSFAGVAGSVPWSILEEELPRFSEFLSLVKKLIGVVNPVYGDIQNMKYSGWDTPLDLQKRLPDVPWLSIYGEPYIRLFGEAKILNAPFYKIEKLPSGHFLLQATESILQPVPDSVRSAIRKHLCEEAFMSGARWRYKDGKAPQFDFSNVIRANT